MTAWHNLLWDSLDVIRRLDRALAYAEARVNPDGRPSLSVRDRDLTRDMADVAADLARTIGGHPPKPRHDCEGCR